MNEPGKVKYYYTGFPLIRVEWGKEQGAERNVCCSARRISIRDLCLRKNRGRGAVRTRNGKFNKDGGAVMTNIRTEIEAELLQHILPFWKGLRDEQNGGYIGRVDFDLTRHPEADKGCILNSRILWFFSEAYMLLKDERLLYEAYHAYEMLRRMTDEDHGGVFWSVHFDGQPADTTKHTYNQAFAIYALSAFYRASGKLEALERAKGLFRVIEVL